jgi:hypothetical protein
VGIAHSSYAEGGSENLATTSNFEIEAPRPADPTDGPFAVRDQLLNMINDAHPEWQASAISGESAIGIETGDGEYFIEVIEVQDVQ